MSEALGILITALCIIVIPFGIIGVWAGFDMEKSQNMLNAHIDDHNRLASKSPIPGRLYPRIYFGR